VAGATADEIGGVDAVPAAAAESDAAGVGSPSDCRWTLVNPSSAADPLTLPPTAPNIDGKDIPLADPDSLDASFAIVGCETINGEDLGPEDGTRNPATRWRGIEGPTAIVGLAPAKREVG
jgi:hypothetical protein